MDGEGGAVSVQGQPDLAACICLLLPKVQREKEQFGHICPHGIPLQPRELSTALPHYHHFRTRGISPVSPCSSISHHLPFWLFIFIFRALLFFAVEWQCLTLKLLSYPCSQILTSSHRSTWHTVLKHFFSIILCGELLLCIAPITCSPEEQLRFLCQITAAGTSDAQRSQMNCAQQQASHVGQLGDNSGTLWMHPGDTLGCRSTGTGAVVTEPSWAG